MAQGDTTRPQKSERQHCFRLRVVCVTFVLLVVFFSFSRRSPASSRACFTKVVSSLSGQRCVVRYLLRSSDFCCVHGTRAHISKQAHTRFELAYQGPSLYIHYHWRQLRLNSCQAACCLRGLVLFCFAWDSLASVKVSLSNTKGAVMQRRNPPFQQFSPSLLVQPVLRRL